MKFYLGAYLREQRHIFGLCPNHECGKISRLAEIEVSYRSRYKSDWLDELERMQAKWDRKIEGLLARQRELKERSKARAEERLLPQKMKNIAPAFSTIDVSPKDIRVVSHPVDFIGFDGMSKDTLKRIVLLDSGKNAAFRGMTQKSIESVVERERYDWQVLRIDDDGTITKE